MSENTIKNPPFPNTYSKEMIVFVEGEGVWLYDKAGKKYLDFASGIAVNALGYGREDLAEIACEQMKKLIHISNLYTTQPAYELAKKITDNSPWCAVHFGNSGTEANEGALKYARLYSLKKKGEGHHKFLSFKNCFHGRTMGALSVTPNPKYQDPFKPLIEGTESIELNNIPLLEETLDETFAAVIIEVVQGEGGLSVITKEFAAALNELCAKHDIILIADEVQTGIGRTGSFYAHTQVGLKPDIVTLSKPLGGGLPLSATLIPEKVNQFLEIGHHASTFGGGPVTTAVAMKVWETVENPEFLKDVTEKGLYLKELLLELKQSFSFLGEVKGLGLMAGIEVNLEPAAFAGIMKTCAEKGLLILRSGANILRILPPLVITKEELKTGMDIVKEVLAGIKA